MATPTTLSACLTQLNTATAANKTCYTKLSNVTTYYISCNNKVTTYWNRWRVCNSTIAPLQLQASSAGCRWLTQSGRLPPPPPPRQPANANACHK